MPLVTGSSTPSPQTVGIRFTELVAPAPDGFVADKHSARCHHLFHIAETHTETEVDPNAFRDDLSREPVTAIEVVRHSSRIAAEGCRST